MKTQSLLFTGIVGVLALVASESAAQTIHRRGDCPDPNTPECPHAKLKEMLEVKTTHKLMEKVKAGMASADAKMVHLGLLGQVVRGAPYAAEAITETTQVLADGNRIERRTTYSIYRDGEGRIRREEQQDAATGEPRSVFVLDPVSRVSYVLDTRNRSARRTPLGVKLEPAMRDKIEAFGVARARTPSPSENLEAGRAIVLAGEKEAGRERTESLGKQIVEGIEAEGTRAITTIPAGEIGNERPIEILFERWYSPELQVNVLTKRSDPRVGETVYRLSNIRRADLPRFLFEVPGGYAFAEARTAAERPRAPR